MAFSITNLISYNSPLIATGQDISLLLHICDPSRFLRNEYRGLFVRGKGGRGVKLTTHVHV
jgi:hypothetical protein